MYLENSYDWWSFPWYEATEGVRESPTPDVDPLLFSPPMVVENKCGPTNWPITLFLCIKAERTQLNLIHGDHLHICFLEMSPFSTEDGSAHYIDAAEWRSLVLRLINSQDSLCQCWWTFITIWTKMHALPVVRRWYGIDWLYRRLVLTVCISILDNSSGGCGMGIFNVLGPLQRPGANSTPGHLDFLFRNFACLLLNLALHFSGLPV
jgi:hypothetical protein